MRKTAIKAFILIINYFSFSLAFAGIPLWTFTPLTATSLTVSPNSSAIVKYQITNQSRRTHTLTMKPVPGITQVITSASDCPRLFSLGYQQSCILNLAISGSALSANVIGGPQVCSQYNPNQCYQPGIADILRITKESAADYSVGGSVTGLLETLVLQNNGGDALTISGDGTFVFSKALTSGSSYSVTVKTQPSGQTCLVSNGIGTIGNADVSNILVNCTTTGVTTLETSVSTLALSVTGLTEFGVPGNPSSGLPRIITIRNTGNSPAANLSLSLPNWPAGTTDSTTCGSTLSIGSSCTITITPGNTATSNGITPCSSGGAPIPGTIQVSADNAAAVSTDVVILNYRCLYQGGLVFALDDTPPATMSVAGKVSQQILAFPPLTQWGPFGVAVTGISETSTAGINSCDGNKDGQCNTARIIAANLTPPVAAAQCYNVNINGFTDWFLPAICEVGYDGINQGSGCGSAVLPLMQNIYGNIGIPFIAWSSTEVSAGEAGFAWTENANVVGGQRGDDKSSLYRVVCARHF
ncbi:NHL repeat protein [Legionella birminghamensis]|uniref:NHL repeat protein n=1 Tax=Legionella birminghamensis TaxID=28083 RepID=A0A378IAY6_9GAMM|nr:hypothetical protein [Legionella birminghamensis]KTC73084.1 NHL repeat protein [Legionella birminghamensis]STX32339.1 NHL repeat protein [Legionella birminghamensis]